MCDVRVCVCSAARRSTSLRTSYTIFNYAIEYFLFLPHPSRNHTQNTAQREVAWWFGIYQANSSFSPIMCGNQTTLSADGWVYNKKKIVWTWSLNGRLYPPTMRTVDSVRTCAINKNPNFVGIRGVRRANFTPAEITNKYQHFVFVELCFDGGHDLVKVLTCCSSSFNMQGILWNFFLFWFCLPLNL